jgi:GNAT superfamily N-acetyltransferase
MNDPILRRAGMADVADLAQLAAQSFAAKFGALYPAEVLARFLAETYSPARTAALVADPAVSVWIAEGERLLGYAVLGAAKLPHADITPGCIELRRLYTAPDATGQGIGTLLMTGVAVPAFEGAAGDAWLGVYSGNPGAQRFYERHGFERVGEYEFPVGPIRDREFILRRRRNRA